MVIAYMVVMALSHKGRWGEREREREREKGDTKNKLLGNTYFRRVVQERENNQESEMSWKPR